MNSWLLIFLGVALLASFPYEVVSKSALKIVNGTTAADGEFPYMVQLRRAAGDFYCGGGILAPEWILTAGHCVSYGAIESIVYGTNKLHEGDDDGNYTSIKVKKWFQHPRFHYTDNGVPLYDVGILQLETPIPFSTTAQPLTIVEANATIPFHVLGVLSGWGKNGTSAYPPHYLQKITLQLLTDEECTQKINDYIGQIDFISAHNLCSDDYYNGQCSGDSGSPYVINGTQYGLVSWSEKPCGVISGAYTRISNPDYRYWIKNVTNI